MVTAASGQKQQARLGFAGCMRQLREPLGGDSE